MTGFVCREEKAGTPPKIESSPQLNDTTATEVSQGQPGAASQPEVDEDGYCIQPKDSLWEAQARKKGSCPFRDRNAIDCLSPFDPDEFYSDSDSESDHDERERKIHVEIKPLNNGSAPISASVDELRATVENLSLSPLGGALSVSSLIPPQFNPTEKHLLSKIGKRFLGSLVTQID